MKLTRRQLRKLIEGSVRKRGDYVIPVEDPIKDPIAGLDYSDEQKPKIKTLAMSDDEENQVYADYIADMGGHEDTDRFGADTFSKKVQATELGIDMLNDLDIDSAISKACDYWIYENKDYLSYYDHIDQDSFEKYADYMIKEYDGDQAIVNAIKVHTTAVLEERIKKLIDISNSAVAVPSVDEKVAYYENSKKLFSTDHNHPAVEDHMIFKFKSVLYPFYLDWKSYYEEEQGYDMSNPEHATRFKERIATFKEGKARLTRGQLKGIIAESIMTGDSSRALDELLSYKGAVWLPKPDRNILALIDELSGSKRGFLDSREVRLILEDMELELKYNKFEESDPGDVAYLLGLVRMAMMGY